MPGRGPAPKPPEARRRRNKPVRGEYQAVPGIGWQFGPPPPAPDGLMEASRVAWTTWMGAWFAAHWSRDDLPGLRQVIRLYDQVERGEFQRAGELRMQMDTYGITPKGQQDRHWTWKAPKTEVEKPPPPERPVPETPTASRYGHLRAVGGNG